MLTNTKTYLAIAREAHGEMLRVLEGHRSSQPDGCSGFVYRHDPDQRSFKQALICITFTGIYFEALTFACAIKVSNTLACKVDRALYEEKLHLFGVHDDQLSKRLKAFRLARKDVVHEKSPSPAALTIPDMRNAQATASECVKLIDAIHAALADVSTS
ncbi:hypothetical protein [Comamonas antarctica]|uniref:hypothetical protein n=1 Tax=Comamonas antarctica TaxID=2743470 RepID=UPI0028E79852|nr:hypothetical protein [Comamonas antarctica]